VERAGEKRKKKNKNKKKSMVDNAMRKSRKSRNTIFEL
jgi:hypothetical protein